MKYFKELNDKLIQLIDPMQPDIDNRERLIEFIKEEVRKSYWNGYDAAKRKARGPKVSQ